MYIVIEIQEAEYGATPALLTTPYADKSEALSKWHSILAFAAKSTLYRHSAVILTTDGKIVARESYVHVPTETEG